VKKFCGTCRFYDQYKAGYGWCRRYPPQVVGQISYEDPGEVYSKPDDTCWPEVSNDQDWCGEWEEDCGVVEI